MPAGTSAPEPQARPDWGYDVFLSHSHADRDFVHALAARLAGQLYNGRPLRPWLDQQVLDLGELSGKAELSTALDRSWLLVIVLSPEALASAWVSYELRHFLESRPPDRVIAIRHRTCEVPRSLATVETIEWGEDTPAEPAFSRLVSRICPGTEADLEVVRAQVRDAWWQSFLSGTSGFDPTPTPGNSALLATLLGHDIGDPAQEGPALAAFDQAGESMLALNPDDGYGMKMLLGEILAAAVLHDVRYRRIATRYLALEPDDAPHPDLSFSVLRASSKLAELDATLVDPSAVWAALAKLDGAGPLVLDRRATAALGGRIAAKLRGTDPGDLLVRVLCEGGMACRTAAIGAITTAHEGSEPEFYLPELARMARERHVSPAAARAPARRLVALLDAIAGDAFAELCAARDAGADELHRAFGDALREPDRGWEALRHEPPAAHLHDGPVFGTVRRITLANMEQAARSLHVSDVACLTEPRIVDALLDGCGAFLILDQDRDSPLCRRLAGRNRRFAMVPPARMGALADGDHVALDARRTLVLPAGPATTGPPVTSS